ncbi:MAG: NADH-quinone oxidoreductase subunit L [Acidimicrobiales bacterium]|nr:NADH-quinone oxidoreductase subunit L [Acidimicrobiales bacterium]RZV47947.1 MAG: NADH-quinone oxidoreductase subunit L [Acidimicrobiales bacterium]
MVDFIYLVPLLPLLGFGAILLFGRRLGEPAAGWLATGAVGGSFVASVLVWIGLLAEDGHDRVVTKTVFEWVPVGDLSVDVGFLVDPLSVAMILFVTGIGALIHLYSIAYMHGDENFSKFFLYMNLFVFSMLMLVLGDNLLLTFLGWEGVGACSYFLISFWFQDEANATAGKKAFVTNRVGDWGFMVATFLCFATIGSINYLDIADAAPQLSTNVATGIALLLFIGAMGKSAQFPLYLWLPDAMAGPTPVSALIHAATMVTSGVYLLTRVNAVLENAAGGATNLIAWVGVGTALYAATIAVAQNDIKKVLAYSTVSQLGYMVLAVGVGAYVPAIFHMITHAFFKALLFLGSGSVIHGMDNDQDMRRYGGLRALMPITGATFIIGWLAIAGVPPFAGFWSKDEILLSAWDSGGLNGQLLWLVGLITALLTAFYMSRQVFMTFFGRNRFAEPDASEVDQAWEDFVAAAESDLVDADAALATATTEHDTASAALIEAENAFGDAKLAMAGTAGEERDAAAAAVKAAEDALAAAQAKAAPAVTAFETATAAAQEARTAVDSARSARSSQPAVELGEPLDAGEATEYLPVAVAERAEHHPHESPWQMTTPLIVLAALSVVGGVLNLPFTKGLHFLEHWLEPALYHEHVISAGAGTKFLLAILAIMAGVVGIAAAVAVYISHDRDPATIERPILANAWGYDAAVSNFMGGPGRRLFDAITWFDATIIDGAVNGAASLARGTGGIVRRVQTGLVRTYALGIAVGAVALLLWFLSRSVS